MFGRKKPKIDLFKNNDISTKNIVNEPQNDKENNYESNNFIFYDDKKKFINKLDICISPTNFNKKYYMVVDLNSNFDELKEQISVNLKTYNEFKNLNKINLEGLYKISNNKKINLPSEGKEKVKDYINTGDILYCYLNTDELWIKTYYTIESYNFKKIIKIEYKLKKKMKYKKFKLMLIKGGINFFIDHIKESESFDFNYYLEYFKFKIKKNNQIIIHNINSKHRMKMPIDKIINYTSEIKVTLNFGVFEKLIHEQLYKIIHEQLKLTKLGKSNILKMNEYADLSFEDLLRDNKFLPELNTIKEIADDFLKNQNEINNPYFLFYSRKKIKSEKNKIFSSKKNIILLDDNKSIDEIKEIKEEDEDKEQQEPQTNDILNIDEIKTREKIKSSNKNKSNINIKNKNNDNPIIKIDEIKNSDNEIKNTKIREKKAAKIKNMIIISKKIIKEEKVNRRFFKMATQRDLNKMGNLYKGLHKIRGNSSISNKNVKSNIYNINNLPNNNEEEYKNSKLYNQDKFKDYYININNEIKPNSFNEEKKLLKLGDNHKESHDGLDELLLDDSQKDIIDFKDKYKTNVRSKKINKIKKKFNLNYAPNSEPYDDDRSSSNFDDDNKSDLNIGHAPKTRKSEKIQTVNYNTRNPFFTAFRNRNKNIDICEDLKSMFDSNDFLNNIKSKCNNFSDKETLEKLKMPQFREPEYLENEHNFDLDSKKNIQKRNVMLDNRFHVHIFMILLIMLLVIILLFTNLDFLSIFLDW